MRSRRLIHLTFISLAALLIPALSAPAQYHSADSAPDFAISLSELLRVIQFFNSDGLSCMDGTEDGYAPGGGDEACDPHDSDYLEQDWEISLSELLRLIQMFNGRGYGIDPDGEDGYIPLFNESDPMGTVDKLLDEANRRIESLTEPEVPAAEHETAKAALINLRLALMQGDLCEAAAAAQVCKSNLRQIGIALHSLNKAQSGQPGKGSPLLPAIIKARASEARVHEAQWTFLTAAGEPSTCPDFERFGKGANFSETASSAARFAGRVSFGAALRRPVFHPNTGDDAEALWLEIFTSPTDLTPLEPVSQQLESARPGEPGMPGLPVWRRLIAVPPGATVDVDCTLTVGETVSGIIAPLPPEPDDQVYVDPTIDPDPLDPQIFADKPVAPNPDIYENERDWPPQPCQVRPLGRMRGLDLYQVEVYAGKYDPDDELIELYESVDLDISFTGGAAGFLIQDFDIPFESNPALYTQVALNADAVPAFPGPQLPIAPNNMGEELMILFDGFLRDAVVQFAAWKNEKGIMTKIYEVGGSTGLDTAQEIDAFIEAHYESSLIKPSYILLFGDADSIPPFYYTKSGGEDGETIGTDWGYASIKTSTEFEPVTATFALGRIPTRSLIEAQGIVDKIIAYEKTPPGTGGVDPFYNRIMLAAQFQCCRKGVEKEGVSQRTYTEAAERVRAPLVPKGYEIDRIYQLTVDNGCADCDPVSPPYLGDPTPRYYYDGLTVHPDIGPGSGFSWLGDTEDIIEGWNEGRFLIMHRDHGSSNGWANPSFTKSDASGLSNGPLQPVVFSINCTTGYFDNETNPGGNFSGDYFAEELLRDPDGGAVGLVAATRVSPSWTNSAFARGLFDAIWPNVLAGFAGEGTHRRLGDIMNHAKLYLLTKIGAEDGALGFGSVYNELLLYHVIGDPTLEIWTQDPSVVAIPNDFPLTQMDNDYVELEYQLEDCWVTAYQNASDGSLVPVGRGLSAEGSVRIEFFQQPELGKDLLLAAQAQDAVVQTGTVFLPLPQ